MQRLRKLWTLLTLTTLLLNIWPATSIAETQQPLAVVLEAATIRDAQGHEVTAENRIPAASEVSLQLDWRLAETRLIETGTQVALALPQNLIFPEQSGSLADDAGTYQVANQILYLTFNQNYRYDERTNLADFSAVRLYQGQLTLQAMTTRTDIQEETVTFNDQLMRTIYYQSEATALATMQAATTQAARPPLTRALEPNLNVRGVALFDNIRITDFDDNEFTESHPALKDANIKIHFDWSLADTEEIQADDYYTYQLPDYFSVHNELMNQELKNDGGEVLGHFSLTTDGQLKIIFNGVGQNLSERAGTIDLKTELNVHSEVEVVEIETGITDSNGQVITIKVPLAKGDIQKTGKITDDNGVIWSIIINQDRQAIRNPVVTDIIPAGLTSQYFLVYTQNEEGEWERMAASFVRTRTIDEQTIEYYFPSITTLEQPLKLEVHMKVADISLDRFTNVATVTGDNILANSSEASVAFSEKGNYKHLISYALDQGIFNWEIHATYTEANGKLKDWLYSRYSSGPDAALHYLVKDSLQVYDEQGNLVPTNKWSLSETPSEFILKEGEYIHFTLLFQDAGSYTIKYRSQAFELPVKPGVLIENYAEVTDGQKKEGFNGNETVTLDSKLGVEKISVSKNTADNTINWRVLINTNRILMKNAVITDRFELLSGAQPTAQQLRPETVKLVATAADETQTTLQAGVDYILETLPEDAAYEQGFVVRLLGDYAATSTQLTMTYQTYFYLDKQPTTDNGTPRLRFTNSTMVSYTTADDQSYMDGDESSLWLGNIWQNNGLKYGFYVEAGQKLASKIGKEVNPYAETVVDENRVYWHALFNTWHATIPAGTTITEELGEGQKLSELKIYDVTVSDSLSVTGLQSEWVENVDYTLTLNDAQQPVITLLKPRTQPFTLFVAAAASEDVYKYKNVATLQTPTEKVITVEGSVEKSDKSHWLAKDGRQNDANHRLVDWSLLINQDSHTINQPVVTDTVKMNEQSFVYDEEKNVIVKVYQAAPNEQGEFVKVGEPITFAEEEQPFVTLDPILGTQTLTISLGEAIHSPYIIEYQTVLDPGIQNNEKIRNEAVLTGKMNEVHAVSKEIEVKSTDGAGTSSGKNGVLKFAKVDESGQFITSSPAFFDLYRKDADGEFSLLMSAIEVRGNKIIDGEAEVEQLSNLRYGDYALIECQAPIGYLKDSTRYEFSLSKEQPVFTFRLENKKAQNQATLTLTAQKELSGRTLQADEFQFKLVGQEDGVEQLKTNDATGLIQFDPLLYEKAGIYTYTISEVLPEQPEADLIYDQTSQQITVLVTEVAGQLVAQISSDEARPTQVPTFRNVYQPADEPPLGEILLEKVDSETGATLADAVFSLLDEAGNVLQTGLVTGAQGTVLIENVPAGTYQLVETQAPNGYQLDAEPLVVKVAEGQTEPQLVVKENQPLATTTQPPVSAKQPPLTKEPTAKTGESKTTQQLPRAGSQEMGAYRLWGWGIVLLSSVGLGIKKRRQQKN